MNASRENVDNPNYAYSSFLNASNDYAIIYAVLMTELVVSFFGALGNGAVIWLLGFRIKRNPFSSYILNLAVADFGVLLSAILNSSCALFNFTELILIVSFFTLLLMYSASQFLLTAISIDRCVAVFVPLWYQRKQSLRLPTIVSALIWVLSVFFTVIACALWFHNSYLAVQVFYQLIVNAILCLPVMTIATVSLFIKVCLKSQPHRRGRLLTVILLTLLFFLFFGFPLNIIYFLSILEHVPLYMRYVTAMLTCLNSSVNPVIYFLVGRQWKSRRRENMKMILEKVFKEEENCTEETPV